jgi:hypothetical protein
MESQEESIEPLPKKLKTSDSSNKRSESDADKSELAAPKNGVVVEVDSQSGVSKLGEHHYLHFIVYKAT